MIDLGAKVGDEAQNSGAKKGQDGSGDNVRRLGRNISSEYLKLYTLLAFDARGILGMSFATGINAAIDHTGPDHCADAEQLNQVLTSKRTSPPQRGGPF